MSYVNRAWDAARRWAAHNEERAISTGVHTRRPKACGGSGSTTYVGRKFYSYSTVVASYHTSPSGKRYVVLTSNQYSPTTTRHMHNVSAAAAQNNKVFRVPYMDDDEFSIRENTNFLFEQARQDLEEAKLKWKYDLPWEEVATNLFNRAVDYTIITDSITAGYVPWNLGDEIAEVRGYRNVKRATYNHPTQIAKRERARARRLAISVISPE